jgi:CHAT domain-containing protein/tetratricopeptide (TPR) repeat protein
MGRHSEALAIYRQILPALSERAEGDLVLNAMGRCYRELGFLEEASVAFRQAASQADRFGDGVEGATALNNLARIQIDKGEFQSALDLLTRALQGFRALHNATQEAMVLCNIGETDVDLGTWLEAIDACQQALAIQRTSGDRHGILVANRNLGAAYLGLRQWPLARARFAETIRIAREEKDRKVEMSGENGLSYVYLMSGETAKASGAAREAQRLGRAVRDRDGEANALGNLGAAYGRSGQTELALDSFATARNIYHQRDEPGSEASILFGRAEVLERAGRLDEARATIEESLALVERLRTRAAGSNLRASFFAARQDYYELYVRVLMKLDRLRPGKGYDARAFEASETTRARTLLEDIAASRLDIAAVADPGLLAREAKIERLLGTAQGERDRGAISTLPEATGRLARLDVEIRRLRTQLDQVRGEMRLHDRRYQVLNGKRPLTLAEIQREILEPGTLLLFYSLGIEESYLWSIDHGALHAHRLPGREVIEHVATAAYSAFATDGGAEASLEVARRAAALSSLILAPVASELAAKRLLIVADGALQFIPFTALPEPRSDAAESVDSPPLVVDHEITYLPSASVAGVLRREAAGRHPAPKELAVFADPVFELDDVRIERSVAEAPTLRPEGGGRGLGEIDAKRSARDVGLDRLPRLRYTRLEADAILGLVPARLALRATDFAASRDLAVSPQLARYRIVHFATHGFLDAIQPELSGLVLSLVDPRGRPRDGFLHAYEIYGLHLAADLVVLSACRTAMGAEVRGEGLMGLTRGFMYAGAPRVVVSLWNISDRATAELMAQFYRGVLQQHLAPATALRAAQLATRNRWPLPYHWAAFELQGDWR